MATNPATAALLARSKALAAFYRKKPVSKAAVRVTGVIPGVTPGYPAGTKISPGGVPVPNVGGGGGNGGGGGGGGGGNAGGLTDAQIAAQIAAAALDPQIKAIQRQQLWKQLAGQNAVETAQRVAQALGALGAQIPGQVQAGYNTAASNIAGYAQGQTGAVGEALRASAAADNAKLAALGLNQTVPTDASGGSLAAAQYVTGTLPATSLASEAASAMAGAYGVEHAGEAGLIQQGMTEKGQRDQEASDLASSILDLEATRPGKVAEALLSLQDQRLKAADLAETKRHDIAGEKVQSAAAGAQISSLNRAWYQTLLNDAKAKTDATGKLYVVKNGKVVPAGAPAPGSAAGRAATTARTAAAKLRYQKAQDTIKNLQADARIGISQQQADVAARRQADYSAYLAWKKKHPTGKATGKNNPGGLSDAEVRQYKSTGGSMAYTLFHGQVNPNFDPKKGGGPGQKPNPANPYYTTRPVSAAQAMRTLLTEVPYSIAWQIVRQYANMPNSPWIDALTWNKSGSEAPGHGPGG